MFLQMVRKSREIAMILSYFSFVLIMGRFYVTSAMISSWEDFTSHAAKVIPDVRQVHTWGDLRKVKVLT